MEIEIRRLTPDLVEDYVHFFDTTPHATGKEEHRCYCVWWSNDDYEGKDLASSLEKRRDCAIEYVKHGNIQGYLAYRDGEVVGWCNANTKMDCLKCYSWRRFMSEIPTEESTPAVKVKSVFCFAIAPTLYRKGIATQLLERVCQDADAEGFDFVEAYPNREFSDEADNCSGPAGMFRKSGFALHYETEQTLVMRKQLK